MYSRSTVETSILFLIFTVSCLKGKILFVAWFVNDFTMLSKTSLFIQKFVKYLCEACAKMEFNFLHLETVVESFLQ